MDFVVEDVVTEAEVEGTEDVDVVVTRGVEEEAMGLPKHVELVKATRSQVEAFKHRRQLPMSSIRRRRLRLSTINNHMQAHSSTRSSHISKATHNNTLRRLHHHRPTSHINGR